MASKQESAHEYLRLIVTPLVKAPDQIKISSHVDESGLGIVLNVVAADLDLSLLIGKKGIVARSVRRLMKVWCDVNDARVLVHIGEPFKNGN